MRDNFLSFSPPSIGGEEIQEAVATLRSDWITTGPKARQFEREFAGFVGARAALAVFSGTDAMHVALAALGVGPGDEVITSPMTFCSTVHVIEHVGARPVLADVEPDTLNIDPRRVEEAIERTGKGHRARGTGHRARRKVRAIMPVHLYGHPCEMDRLLKIAESQGLFVVEDAAHALPAQYKGRTIGSPAFGGPLSSRQKAVGSQADLQPARCDVPPGLHTHNPQSTVPHAPCPVLCASSEKSAFRILTAFSFYATKNMTTAEGGMLTGDPELIEKARVWSLHGMSRDAYRRYSSEGSWFYEVVLPGFKCNMTDIQASLGLQQLKKLPAFQARRREIVRQYNEAFSRMPALRLPVERPEVESAWHLYVIRLNLEMLRIGRDQFIEELRARNIGASVHFIPIHLHKYYRDKYGYKPDDFPVAYREYQRIVSLPLYPRMTDEDVNDVIEAVHDVLTKFAR